MLDAAREGSPLRSGVAIELYDERLPSRQRWTASDLAFRRPCRLRVRGRALLMFHGLQVAPLSTASLESFGKVPGNFVCEGARTAGPTPRLRRVSCRSEGGEKFPRFGQVCVASGGTEPIA